jgi:hypothetical protein
MIKKRAMCHVTGEKMLQVQLCVLIMTCCFIVPASSLMEALESEADIRELEELKGILSGFVQVWFEWGECVSLKK